MMKCQKLEDTMNGNQYSDKVPVKFDTVEAIRTDGYRERGIFVGSNFRQHRGEIVGFSGVSFLRGTKIKITPYTYPFMSDDVENNIFITEIVPVRLVLFEKILDRFDREIPD